MMIDPFAPYAPLFTMTALTASIDSAIYMPQQISGAGLYTSQGLTTTTAWVEYRDDVLFVFDVLPRGAPGQRVTGRSRNGEEFAIPHIPAEGEMMADEVQGVRAFGTENVAETVQSRIDSHLSVMRQSMDYTKEYHRMLNFGGEYMTAGGSIASLHTKLGTTKQTADFGVSDNIDTDGRAQVFDIKKGKIRKALGGLPYRGLHAYCSEDFFEGLLTDKGRKDTYKNQPQAGQLREEAETKMTLWGVTWEWYDGDELIHVPEGKAYLFPKGVPGLFLTRNAPANYAETVNTQGRPYYAKSQPMDFNKGMEFEAQANPLNIVTRPQAIIELTRRDA
jgi:hypothetical protein